MKWISVDNRKLRVNCAAEQNEPHRCHPCSSDVTLRGGEERQARAWLIKRSFTVAALIFQPTRSFPFAWRIHLFVTWSGILWLWTIKPWEFKTQSWIFLPTPCQECLSACKCRMQAPRATGPFMWTPQTLFLCEEIAWRCPLLCVHVRINNLLHLITLRQCNYSGLLDIRRGATQPAIADPPRLCCRGQWAQKTWASGRAAQPHVRTNKDTAIKANKTYDLSLIQMCCTLKGTVHPKIKNTFLCLLPVVLHIHLDCFGVSWPLSRDVWPLSNIMELVGKYIWKNSTAMATRIDERLAHWGSSSFSSAEEDVICVIIFVYPGQPPHKSMSLFSTIRRSVCIKALSE